MDYKALYTGIWNSSVKSKKKKKSKIKIIIIIIIAIIINKAISIIGLGGLHSCEMLRIPHCLENRLTVNCEILATCSSTYSPVRTSKEAHSVSIK
jgi:flagellar basal body-associated protein FliL